MRALFLSVMLSACAATATVGDDTDPSADSDPVADTDTTSPNPSDDTDPADTDAGETDAPDSDADDTDAPDTDVTPSAGACDNAADLGVLAASTDDLDDVTQACTFSCLQSQTRIQCVSTCVRQDIAITPACANCFGRISVCITNNCLLQCIDATSASCEQCRVSQCEPGFLACAGIAPP